MDDHAQHAGRPETPLPATSVQLPPSRRAPRAPRTPRRVGFERPHVLLALGVTVLALPALLVVPRLGSKTADVLRTAEGRPAAAFDPTALPVARAARPVPTAASTTEPLANSVAASTAPTTAWVAPTTAVPQVVATTPPTTAWVPPTTAWAPPPTTAPPATAPPPPPPPPTPVNQESGQASWYDWRPGQCAHKTIPKGTVVTIHASNGATATCTVTDRGPFGAGRIIDLDRGVFAQLASPGTGVISVTITW